MDELKLNRWIQNFNKEVVNLQIEFDIFFQDSELMDCYKIKTDEVTQNLFLVITNQALT